MIVASVLERTASAARESMGKVAPHCDWIEVRGDHLHGNDLAELVAGSPRPTIATLRDRQEGGAYRGSEEERTRALRGALDAGARYVDVEWPERASRWLAGPEADRVLVSDHGLPCRSDRLIERWREMSGSAAGKLKIVPRVERTEEIAALAELLGLAEKESPGRLIAFGLGRAGALSRITALAWGSWATYGSVAFGAESAPGQFPARDLRQLYDVSGIGRETGFFVLIGARVFASPSPAMHNRLLAAASIDARYVPVELERVEELDSWFRGEAPIPLRGFAVTMPHKTALAGRVRASDALVSGTGSLNTVVAAGSEWLGFNTDGPGLAACLDRSDAFRSGQSVLIVGSGGTAQIAARIFLDRGCRVVLANRSRERAQDAADRLGVESIGLDQVGASETDVVVNATPLGSSGQEAPPFPRKVRGLVIDFVYREDDTPWIAEARRRGVASIDGLELLAAQAALQHERWHGTAVAAAPLAETARAWLRSYGA